MRLETHASIDELCNEISEWIRRKVGEANLEGGVLGLSGGIDSAVTAILSKKALDKKVLGIIMPCHSNLEDVKCARELAEKFDLPTREICLDTVYDEFTKILPSSGGNRIAQANIKPRIRMITLYYFANLLNYLVIGTGNKSELIMGYFTKYGDGGVDILPLGNFLKTEVKEMAGHLGVPESILSKPPSAGLWSGQTDEEEMGVSYEEIDRAIRRIEGERVPASAESLEKVRSAMKRSQHKRSLPPIFNSKDS